MSTSVERKSSRCIVLALQFDDKGVGQISLNDDKIPSPVFADNAGIIVRSIGNEAKRRFDYLAPRIGKPITGSIKVEDQQFVFADPVELDSSITFAETASSSFRAEL